MLWTLKWVQFLFPCFLSFLRTCFFWEQPRYTSSSSRASIRLFFRTSTKGQKAYVRTIEWYCSWRILDWKASESLLGNGSEMVLSLLSRVNRRFKGTVCSYNDKSEPIVEYDDGDKCSEIEVLFSLSISNFLGRFIWITWKEKGSRIYFLLNSAEK